MSYSLDSYEFQLALSCSALDKERAVGILEKVQELSTFNEVLFLDIIKRHHIQELAFQTLAGNSFFSETFKVQIKQQAEFNQLKALKGLSIQVKLQSYFDENKIDAIFLKGLLLSHLYYGDIAKRNLVDLDVWVPNRDFDKVKAYLGEIGYKSIIDLGSWNDSQLRFIKFYSHDEIFVHQTDFDAPVIELHWKLRNALGNFMFDPFKEQSKLMKVELGGVWFSVFNHVDQFIFLSVHGAEHGWFKIKWLVDLYHLVKNVDLDWASIVSRAKELRSLIEVRMALNLLEEFYGLRISKDSRLNSLTVTEKLRLHYIRHLISYNGAFCDSQKEKFLNVLYTLSLNRRFLIPKELILKNLTNTTDWLTLPLPRNLFFLYFPLRPFLWLYRKIKFKLF